MEYFYIFIPFVRTGYTITHRTTQQQKLEKLLYFGILFIELFHFGIRRDIVNNNENVYKRLRESTETNSKPALTQPQLAEEFAKQGNPVSQSMISKIENSKKNPPTKSPTILKAYADYFNVTTDYLLGIRDTKQADENIAMISKVTGLNEDAINTLIKLKSGKYHNQYKFDYALHTLNLILATYENSNLFELIYHFLFGNYDTMGHYDEIGNEEFDGSECFISDKYRIDRMSIDSELVNKAILLQITEQLQYWKNSLVDKNDTYGKVLPSKDKLLQVVKNKYSHISNLIRDYLMAKDIYEKRKKQTPIDYESLFYATESVASYRRILEQNYREIPTLNYPLIKLYDTEYHDKEIDDFIEKEVINNGSY